MLRGDVLRTEVLLELERGITVITREACLVMPNGERVKFHRAGISTGHAVSILPYFRDTESGEWMVIMVSQFRPHVNEVCLEAPGSLVQVGLSPEEQMVRAVKEETNLIIPQNCIKILGSQYTANSFSDQKVWLGVVELESMFTVHIQQKLRGRTDPESEQEITEVVMYPLRYLLDHRAHIVANALTSLQLMDLALHLRLLVFVGGAH